MEQDIFITALKEGDQIAFRKLFEKYYKPLCAYIQTYTNDWDLTEEIVQESFIVLWQKRTEVNSSLKSYLYTIAYHNFLLSLRQKKKENKLLSELKVEALNEAIQEDETRKAEKIKILEAIIKELPPRCREVLLLKQQGLKYSEIADKLQISVKTVEAQLRIAFSRIKKQFRKKTGIFIFIANCLRKKGPLFH